MSNKKEERKTIKVDKETWRILKERSLSEEKPIGKIIKELIE